MGDYWQVFSLNRCINADRTFKQCTMHIYVWCRRRSRVDIFKWFRTDHDAKSTPVEEFLPSQSQARISHCFRCVVIIFVLLLCWCKKWSTWGRFTVAVIVIHCNSYFVPPLKVFLQVLLQDVDSTLHSRRSKVKEQEEVERRLLLVSDWDFQNHETSRICELWGSIFGRWDYYFEC